MVGSHIQSYAFIDGEEQGIPKPPLYDLLRPFPFWAMEMSLMLPTLLVFMPFRSIGLSHLGWSGLFQVVYFYLLSCFIVFSYDEHKNRFSRKYWMVVSIVSAILGFVFGGIWNLSSITELINNYLGSTITLILYIYLLSSLGFFAYNLFRAGKIAI